MENRKHSIPKLIRRVQRRPEDDPSNAQTADTISAHYRNAKVGDIAVIPKRMAAFLLASVPASGRWPSAEKLYRSLIKQRIYVRWFDEEGLRNERLVKALRIIAGLKDTR
jgi:histidinol-phosphate/aromatic aminotransferase/cobyric acid decarboxylase-like protein